MCQSLYARQNGERRVLVVELAEQRPRSPGNDGKLSVPSSPLADMSSTRSLTS
jgi:hypothetical protein